MTIRKPLAIIISLLFLLSPLCSLGQHNPYLDRKKKNRPSAKMARETRRDLKKGKRLARKQMRKTKRSLIRSNNRKLKGR